MTPEAQRAFDLAYREKNKEKLKKQRAAWQLANYEKCKESHKRWRDRNRDKLRIIDAAYRAANPEQAKIRSDRYYRENRERKLQDNAAWRAANKDRMQELVSNWIRKNPEKIRVLRVAGAHRRRARLRNVAEHYSIAEIEALKARAGRKCAYCGSRKSLTIDHIKAIARGGTNAIRNIQFACLSCNMSKGAKDPIEFAQSRGLLL